MSVPIVMKMLGSLLVGVAVFFPQTPEMAKNALPNVNIGLVEHLILSGNQIVAEASPPSPVSAFQTSPPPPDSNRLYLVHVGPVSDRDRAAAIAKQLSVGGFVETKITDQTGYRVVSEPFPRGVAEGLVAPLAGRGIHSQIEPLGGDTVQLLFGIFTGQKEAETLAQRIGVAGYDAWVRGGTVYTLQLGPYPQSSVDTITRIVKSGAPEATVTADPVSAQTSPAPAASTPKAPPAAQAPQTSPPPPDSNRLYLVRVGFSDRDRAAAMAKQLSVGGFAEAKVTDQTGFRVVSEPLPRSAAEGLVATLAGRGIHSQVEPLGGDTVQLLFGTFTGQKEAETLAQRIGAAGYDAWVRGGTVYTLQLGPLPQSSVDAITGIIKSGAPEATVTADPVSAQTPTPPPAPAPQVSPAVSAPQTTTQAPGGSTDTSSRPATPNPSQPAAQAPSQATSRGSSQEAAVAPLGPAPSASSSTAGAAPFLIVPGQSLGSVRLGMPVRDETARLGASKGSVQLDDGTVMFRWFEPPSNSGIGVRSAQSGAVLRVWVLNDERYRTKEGLHIGSTEPEVRAALGNPTLVDVDVQGKTRTLVYEPLGLWFSIQLDQQYRFYNLVFDIGIMAPKK